MIPMPISVAEYIEHQPLAPEYMFGLKRIHRFDKIGRVLIPEDIRREYHKFLPYAEVLKVSPNPAFNTDGSINVDIESRKAIIALCKYVTFEYHAVAIVNVMPQFKLPSDEHLICLHVRDAITYGGKGMEELLEKQRAWEAEEERKANES